MLLLRKRKNNLLIIVGNKRNRITWQGQTDIESWIIEFVKTLNPHAWGPASSMPNSMNPVFQNLNRTKNFTDEYAEIINNCIFPQKDQTIVLKLVEELYIKDYVNAIGKIVAPRSTRFTSHTRVCIYLDSKEKESVGLFNRQVQKRFHQ